MLRKTFMTLPQAGEILVKLIQNSKTHIGLLDYLFGEHPHPATITTRIITFLARDPYKSSVATIAGLDPNYFVICISQLELTSRSRVEFQVF